MWIVCHINTQYTCIVIMKMFTPVLKGLMLYSCYFYYFTCTGVLHDFNIRWCSSRINGKRGMSLVEQIFHIPHNPEHLSSPLVLCRVRVVQSFVFCAVIYISQFVLLSVSLWPWYCLVFVTSPLAMILSVFFDVRLLVTSLISSNLSCTLATLSYARYLFLK